MFHDVGQLADVAGPMVLEQDVDGFRREPIGHLLDRPFGGAGQQAPPRRIEFTAEQQAALLKRFVLLDGPGKALLSTSSDGHPVMRCESGGITSEMRFGATESGENLAGYDSRWRR